MSKLKEIIHQYVVEALQELLDEENAGDTTHYTVSKAGHRAIMKSGLHQHAGVDYDPDNNRLSVTHYGGRKDENARNDLVASHEKSGHLIKANTSPLPKGQAINMPNPVKESADQINELSDDLLYNYKRKARKAINKLNSPPPSNPDSPRAKQLENRVKGFRLAWDKLGRK